MRSLHVPIQGWPGRGESIQKQVVGRTASSDGMGGRAVGGEKAGREPAPPIGEKREQSAWLEKREVPEIPLCQRPLGPSEVS